jgi:hypothetical protein
MEIAWRGRVRPAVAPTALALALLVTGCDATPDDPAPMYRFPSLGTTWE